MHKCGKKASMGSPLSHAMIGFIKWQWSFKKNIKVWKEAEKILKENPAFTW